MAATALVSTSKAPLSPDTSSKHKPILAERFKTKMCRTWVDKGECPYEFRCMFAHGEADLRTKAMNVADGLTTDEAIRAFQYAAAPATSATPTLPASPSADRVEVHATVLMKKPADLEPSHLLRFVAALTSPAKDLLGTPSATPAVSPTTTPRMGMANPIEIGRDDASERSCVTPTSSMRRYRHDPYAPVVMGPASLSSTIYGACFLNTPDSPISSPSSRMSPGAELDVAVCDHVLRSTSPSTTYGAFSALPSPARSYAAAAASVPRTKPLDAPVANATRVLSTYGPKTTYCAS